MSDGDAGEDVRWILNTCTCFSLTAEKYDHLAAEVFEECLFSPKERASFYIGMTSLGFWILCQFPQFVHNYRNKSAEGLAAFLLVQWLCGDTMNLIGSLLTRQLSFQRYSAMLFVLMDLAMISQKFVYSRRTPITMPSSSVQPLLVVSVLALAGLPLEGSAQEEEQYYMIRSCEPHPDIADTTLMVGNVLGWISSCFYVGSRIAQIYKNWQRQSTEGIASTMFYFAIMGNLTYSLGIILRSDHLEKAVPWLVGSLLCMSLDVFIVNQTKYYARMHSRSKEVEFETDHLEGDTQWDRDGIFRNANNDTD